MVRRSLNFQERETFVDEVPVSLKLVRQALRERIRELCPSLESRECWS
jgi:hypothetical protein